MDRTAIERRELMRGAAAFGLALPFAGLRPARGAAEAALVDRRVFFDNPDYRSVHISPDGEHIAYLAPLGGVSNLWVALAADPQSGRPLTHVADRGLGGNFRWAHTNRHIVFFQEHEGDENWRASSVDIGNGAIRLLTPESGVKSFIQESERKFPQEMLIRHNQRDKRFFDLFRVDIVTGRSELLYENRDYVFLITDSDFRLRLGGRFAKDGSAEVFERREDDEWTPFMTVPIGPRDAAEAGVG